jgi:hypothetical protein
MSIRVTRPETGFSTIPNEIIQNPDISAVARMLWIYLASLPHDWRPRASHLQDALGVGRDKLQACCAELEAAGLLERTPDRDEKTGRVFGYVWQLLTGCLKNRQTAEPSTGQTRQPVNQAPYKETLNKKTKNKRNTLSKRHSPRDKDKDFSLIGDWRPSDDEIKAAAVELVGSLSDTAILVAETTCIAFVDHAKDKGRRSQDWPAAWRNWVQQQKRRRQ